MRSLPRIVSQIPADLRNFLDRVREYMGSGGEDRFVTLSELKRGGIVGTTPNGTITEPTPNGVETPNLPRGLTATGAFATVILEWAAPDYLGHAYTEVWAAPVDDFSLKELVGSTDGNIFSHNLGTGATRYYWIRFVNKLDTAGPFNATAGTLGQTSQDPDYLIEVLSEEYGTTGPAPFFQVDNPTVINGVTVPAGTYIKQAWIADATISRAKIQDLAVDNAKISDLSATKITAGAMQVGSYIESQSYSTGVSGWRINANGSAEFAQAVIRGSIFGGNATAYSTGTGLFSGLDGTTYKFRVGTPGGNQVTWDGSALSVTGTLLGGTATAYATGTGLFSGDVSGTYRWRVGNPAGARIQWTGSALEVYNASNILTIASGDINYSVITGTKPPADATRNVVFRQSSAPSPTTSQTGDVWFNTSNNSTYYFNGSGWVLAGDVTANNTAASVAGQGSLATVSGFSSANATTYIADQAFAPRLLGEITSLQSIALPSLMSLSTNVSDQPVLTLNWSVPSIPGLSSASLIAVVSFNVNVTNYAGSTRRVLITLETNRTGGTTSPNARNFNPANIVINAASSVMGSGSYTDYFLNWGYAAQVAQGQTYTSTVVYSNNSTSTLLDIYSAIISVVLYRR